MPFRLMNVCRLLSLGVFVITLVPSGAAAQTVAQTPAPPPSLFPAESRIAFVDLSAIASNSVPGKALIARLKTFRDGKLFELNEKQKQLDGMQAQLAGGTVVLNDSARAQLAKNIEKMKRDIQFGSEDAEAQLKEIEQDGFADLQKRITPILKEIAAERHLDAIFSMAETAAPFVDPRIDVSAEVTKRLDASIAKK